MSGVAGIVLAAGRSTRMGQQKLLMPFGASTMIDGVAACIAASGCDPVIVVTGSDDRAVRAAVRTPEIEFVQNPDVDRGMISSIRCGVEVAPNASAYLVALGDMPQVSVGVVKQILTNHGGSRTAITIPIYDDRRGHPIIVGAEHRDAILTKYDDQGLRGLMRDQTDSVQTVSVDTSGILVDLDTPEDYERALRGEK